MGATHDHSWDFYVSQMKLVVSIVKRNPKVYINGIPPREYETLSAGS